MTAGHNYEESAQRLQTALAGGCLPGLVIFSDVWWFRYLINDSVIPLGSLLTAVDIDTVDFRPSCFSEYKFDGQQWAVPHARQNPLFCYNKTHWAAPGLPDRAPTTWQEFGDWAPKLKGASTGAQNAFQYPAIAVYPRVGRSRTTRGATAGRTATSGTSRSTPTRSSRHSNGSTRACRTTRGPV